MKTFNRTRQKVLCNNLKRADRFLSRFKGLMGHKQLEPGTGLLIVPCNSIHMFFMRFPIDAIFLDKEGIIIHLIKQIQPWKVSRVVWKAHSVLELPAGTIDATGTQVGDIVEIE